ncbi:MAG: DUF1616 domain-containing protein [Patescibacteria group bacterium]|nr:DUF1616 domain-containing protein [Patescibacteria group bacterium]
MRIILISGIVAVIVLVGTVVFWPAIVAFLDQNRLLPVPESYTELYLEDHLEIPVTLMPEQTASASFTIRNRERRTMNYRYTVSRTTGTDTARIASGTARLADGQARSFRFDYSIATTEPKTRFAIELDGMNQQIHFWINNIYKR